MTAIEPIKIGILFEADSSWLGGVYYFTNLIKALGRLDEKGKKTHITVLTRNDTRVFENERVETITLPKRAASPFAEKFRWRAKELLFGAQDPLLEEIVRKNGIHFLYPYVDQRKHPKFASAAWIYDFQHKYLPHFFSEKEIRSRDRMFSRIAKFSQTVVVSSNSSARDFSKFYPRFSHKVHVLSFKTCIDKMPPASDVRRVVQKYHLPEAFFMVCNQFWRHKNHLLVFEALSVLKEKGLKANVILTGHLHDYRCPQYQDEILQSIHHYGIHESVYLLGRIPKEDYLQLIRASLAVVQPSLFEGWSSVVEDARAVGKGIILSDLPVHREQNPPGAVYFNPTSGVELSAMIEKGLEQLKPGPDLKAEEKAYEASKIEINNFASSFYKIALTSIGFKDKKR